MSNLGDLKRKIAGGDGLDIGGHDTVNQLNDFVVDYQKAAADGMASTTTAALSFWHNPYDFTCYVVSGTISPAATLTAHDDNNATITVEVDDAANGTPAAALTWNTDTVVGGGTGNWAVDTAVPHVTRTAANCAVVPGANLHVQIAKGGSGVVVPVSRIAVRMRRGEV